jgi:uncharacterized cupredoxin-like copper-binding protein/Cu/Ag efflux protein CusF
MNKILLIALFSTMLIAIGATHEALAHGTESHAKKPDPNKSISKVEHPWGREGDPAKATRTVEIDMSDAMRFSPDKLEVRQGDTVKFVVRNSGKVMHEMVIGSDKELKAHAGMMKKHPGMEHDEPYMAHVSPGKKEEMVWQFTKPGDFMFGCLIPGHFEAGMVGKITVVGTAGSPGIKDKNAHNAAYKTTESNATPAGDMVEAEVRKVDKDQAKLTLKHGELKSLDMPPMTMVFRVKDPAILETLTVGDKIKFRAEKINGAFTVTQVAK